MVALLEDLVADDGAGTRPAAEDRRRTARLLGTLGVELAFSADLTRGVRHAERAVALAREIGDPELLGRTLNNYRLAVWGRPGAAELRLAATDEALGLAGHGLPRRTEFFARLHRAAIRLHLTDVAGFDADLAAARRLALSLSGPEVRPHVLWQAAGSAWLRGDAAAAEQLTDEAYELYRVVTPHARHAWAAHQFALRRAEHRLDSVVDLLVETGDEGSPLLREMAVLAAAAAGDQREALRLRRALGPHRGAGLGQRRRRPGAGRDGAAARRRAGVGRRRGLAAALLRTAGGPRHAGVQPGLLRRAARPVRRAPRATPAGRGALVAGRPGAGPAGWAHRTSWTGPRPGSRRLAG